MEHDKLIGELMADNVNSSKLERKMNETETIVQKEETQEKSQSQYEKQGNSNVAKEEALQKESTTSLEYSPI